MKIAIVRPYANILSETGYNVQEFGLAKALLKQNISVDVYCGGNAPGVECIDYAQFEKERFRIYCLPFNTVFSYQGIFPGMLKLLSSGGYNLFQTQGYEQFTSFLVTRLGVKSNVPIVLHQGVYESTYGRLLKLAMTAFHHSMGRYMRRHINGCIAKTDKANKFLLSKGFENIVKIPIGLDVDKFGNFNRISWRDRLKLGKNCFILLYVGVIEPRRNLDFLVRVVAELVDRKKDVYLVVAGTGPDEEKCKILSKKLNLEKRVIFLGKLNQKDLPCLYRDANLFVLASDYEIVGMVLLEALYFNLPVLSTKTAGALDIIDRKSGKLIDGLDYKKWVDFLGTYIDTPEKYRYREHLEKSYFQRTWNNLGKHYADYYRSLVRN